MIAQCAPHLRREIPLGTFHFRWENVPKICLFKLRRPADENDLVGSNYEQIIFSLIRIDKMSRSSIRMACITLTRKGRQTRRCRLFVFPPQRSRARKIVATCCAAKALRHLRDFPWVCRSSSADAAACLRTTRNPFSSKSTPDLQLFFTRMSVDFIFQ